MCSVFICYGITLPPVRSQPVEDPADRVPEPGYVQGRSRVLGGRNRLRWLGIVNQDGQPDVNNANRKRLVAFYGPNPRPDWLA
jgi:hypothetical protein